VSRSAGTLGTFGGVFTPSILTILGLILFLRIGFVVGHGGVLDALVILALATAVSVLTSLSLSAISTTRRVRGGGVYFLISRSLGVSYGGAIGLVMFAAQAISVGFYCVGFAEGVAPLIPGAPTASGAAIAAAVAAILLVIAYLGSDLAMRFQYVVMGILGAALASVFVGALELFDAATLENNWSVTGSSYGFWVLFAIFFPAVTGFTQGVNMSGDLANPARSIPLGTFLAVGISTIVYAAVILLLGAALPASELAADSGALKRAAAISWLVDGGVLAATLSSALASFLGAPRILQALAVDRIFPRLAFFAAGSGAGSNPRRAVILTGGIAFATIFAGSLNAIASVVSMFFLISYGLLNYATYVEATAASPSFRPRFRFFHARASLAGTLLCGGVMIAIDPVAGVVAAALIAAVYQYLNRTAVPVRWRDSRRAYRFRRVKLGLREIASEPEGPLDWQPHVLVFTQDPERRPRVLRFASWITGGSGLVTATSLVEGVGTSDQVRRRCAEIEAALRAEIAELDLDIYPLAVGAPDLRTAMATLLQAWGVGPLRSNTVLLNWRTPDASDESSAGELWYGRTVAGAVRLRQHVIVFDSDGADWERLPEIPLPERRIDVWWFEDESSRLALLLAHLMTRTEQWEDATIRVLAPATEEKAGRLAADLEKRIDDVRIDAESEVVVDPRLEDVVARSGDAALVLVPLRVEGMRLSDAFGFGIDELLPKLPIVALIAASQDVRLSESESESEAQPAHAPGGDTEVREGTDAVRPQGISARIEPR
jgi:amino acid transporter